MLPPDSTSTRLKTRTFAPGCIGLSESEYSEKTAQSWLIVDVIFCGRTATVFFDVAGGSDPPAT